jgi:hypothetical protein
MRAVNCHPSPPNQQAPTPSVPKCLSLENRVSLTDTFSERLPLGGRSSIYYQVSIVHVSVCVLFIYSSLGDRRFGVRVWGPSSSPSDVISDHCSSAATYNYNRDVDSCSVVLPSDSSSRVATIKKSARSDHVQRAQTSPSHRLPNLPCLPLTHIRKDCTESFQRKHNFSKIINAYVST